MMIETTFKVMLDEEGEELVEKGLMSLDGVVEAEADRMMDLVVVKYDPEKVTVRQMQDMVDMCGYDLEV